MTFHGISHYQFYTALKHVDGGTRPSDVHGNDLVEHCAHKQDLCHAYFERLCKELAECLPTGFRLELNRRVFSFC